MDLCVEDQAWKRTLGLAKTATLVDDLFWLHAQLAIVDCLVSKVPAILRVGAGCFLILRGVMA
jgi:hypothetical protein